MRFTTILKASQYLLSLNKHRKTIISDNFYSLVRYHSSSPSDAYDIRLQGRSLKTYISSLVEEHQLLLNDSSKCAVSRKRELEPIMHILEERNVVIDGLKNLLELLNSSDPELKKLAEQEKLEYETKIKELDENLLLCIVPKDEDELFNSLILEVQAGVGGQEAMLFAKEVFDMYQQFSEYKGWEHTVAEYLTTDIGGIRGATAIINGTSAYQHLRHEAGIHRVQRIPATERGGRVHTSTISVIILPQPSEIQINIDPKDLKIEVKRASGAGGQHVNKTESAVRLVHLPTGIAVECQEDRSQIKNRKIAMAKLSALLYDRQLSTQQAEEASSRKSQVKTRNRNEKIRTFNFKDDRVTDHRIGVNCYNLKEFFKGEESLNNLILRLNEKCKLDTLLNLINSKQ